MKTSVKLITPEYAEQLLKKNTINRIPNLFLVSEYARLMANGLWNEETGETIKIAVDGTLLDGQQRLMAVVKSNVSLKFLIVEDLDKTIFMVIDTNKKRTSGDTFHCVGVANATNIAASIKRYLLLKGGKNIGHTTVNIHSVTYSSKELLFIYNNNPKLWNEAFNMSTQWYNKSGRLVNKSDMLAYYMFFRDIDEDDAFKFMSMFGEGVGLSFDNPIKLLRERLAMAKMDKLRMPVTMRSALIIKTWNLFRENKKVKTLQVPQPDKYPIAI